jgi:hypothetical protein
MELVAIEEGFITTRIHWTTVQKIAAALDRVSHGSAEWELLCSLTAGLEAAAMAGRSQMLTFESESYTLETHRNGEGIAAVPDAA